MAGSKYGRLFTEVEIHRVALYAAIRALGLPIERSPDGALLAVVAEADAAARDALRLLTDEGWTFPPDEPLFLLRGQDIAARRTVEVYEDTARTYCASLEHLAAVNNVLSEMRKWQLANPGRVKVPD